MEINKDIVSTFVEFAIKKHSLVINFFYFTSDHFSQDLLHGTVYQRDYELFFREVGNMAQRITPYTHAMHSLNMVGLADSFCKWLTEVGSRSRKRILYVTDGMPASECDRLFDKLRKEWKTNTDNWLTFNSQLNNGVYDAFAAQLFGDFFRNSQIFARSAQRKGLTLDFILKQEGALCVHSGALCATDLVSEDSLLYSGTTGTDILNLSTQLLNSPITANCLPEVEELFTDAELAKSVATSIKHTYEVLTTTPETAIEDPKKGLVMIESEAVNNPLRVIISRKEVGTNADESPSFFVLIGSVKDTAGYYVAAVLDYGKWFVTTIDQEGYNFSRKVEVTPGHTMTVKVISDAREEPENSTAERQHSWDSLCRLYEWVSNIPPFTYPFTFFDYDYDVHSAFWTKHLRIVCKRSDAQNYSETLEEKKPIKVAEGEVALYVFRDYPQEDMVMIDFVSLSGKID